MTDATPDALPADATPDALPADATPDALPADATPDATPPPDAALPRVDLDDLDVAWGGSQHLYQGEPFTGVAFETHPSGVVVAETAYRDGFPFGPAREWYGPGRPREEMTFGPRGLHGPARRWHPNGVLQSETLYDNGAVRDKREWDEQGRPLPPPTAPGP